MEFLKKNRRGRPSVSDDGGTPVTSTVPPNVADRLHQVSIKSGISTSEVIRKQLIAIQDAHDIVPTLQRLQWERDEALDIAKQTINMLGVLIAERDEAIQIAKEIVAAISVTTTVH